jgi:hypothetical protein
VPYDHYGDTKDDPDRDVRHDTRMACQAMNFFANVVPLKSLSLKSTCRGHGWFDECVWITRRRMWENGTGDAVRLEAKEQWFDNGWDFTQWDNHQLERDRSLTLDNKTADDGRPRYSSG